MRRCLSLICLIVLSCPHPADAMEPASDGGPPAAADPPPTRDQHAAPESWEVPHDAMLTRWGKRVTPANAWREYPRPQFQRQSWTNLNGLWDYAIENPDTAAKGSTANGPTANRPPDQFDGKILVPFAMESALSGVRRLLQSDERLWYRRTLQHKTPPGHRTLLHFEAVDYEAEAYVNGRSVGKHVGSSDPFSFDITDSLHDDENELTLCVVDKTAPDQTLGKQSLEPKGIYYTRVSGIWQTVWLEDVPLRHISSVKMKPRLGENTLRILPTLGGQPIDGEQLR